MRAYDLPVPGIPHLYTYLPKTPRTEPGKNELHYCQRGLPFTSSGSQTEFIWKRDIRLGWKALRLKAKHANLIRYCQLPKELKNRVNDFNYLHNPIFEFLVMRQGRASACDVPKELKNRVNDFNYLHNPIFEFLVMRQGRASACDVGKLAVVKSFFPGSIRFPLMV